MRYSLALLLPLVLVTGCASDPFPDTDTPPLTNPDPAALRDSFAHRLPDHFISEDTIIIQAPFHDDLAVLGVLRVDRKAGTFELAALNPLGVELFRLTGDRTGNKIASAIGPLQKRTQILLAMAEDIRHIYFDLLPIAQADSDIESTYVEFDHANMAYEFGGRPPVLLEKRHDWLLGTVWRVRYYKYTSAADGSYPRGIVMTNYVYHYRIIIKNLTWKPK